MKPIRAQWQDALPIRAQWQDQDKMQCRQNEVQKIQSKHKKIHLFFFSLEGGQTGDTATCCNWPCSEQRMGLEGIQRCLPASAMLWACEILTTMKNNEESHNIKWLGDDSMGKYWDSVNPNTAYEESELQLYIYKNRIQINYYHSKNNNNKKIICDLLLKVLCKTSSIFNACQKGK